MQNPTYLNTVLGCNKWGFRSIYQVYAIVCPVYSNTNGYVLMGGWLSMSDEPKQRKRESEHCQGEGTHKNKAQGMHARAALPPAPFPPVTAACLTDRAIARGSIVLS